MPCIKKLWWKQMFPYGYDGEILGDQTQNALYINIYD